MPEAAVDEHCNLDLSEHDVCRAPELGQGASGHPIAEPGSVEEGTDQQFGFSLAALVAKHGLAYGGVGRPRLGSHSSTIELRVDVCRGVSVARCRMRACDLATVRLDGGEVQARGGFRWS